MGFGVFREDMLFHYDSIRIIGPGDGALVGVGDRHPHIFQGDAIDMAEIEAPYREVTEHGELGIVRWVLGDGDMGIEGNAATGIGDADVFESYVFHFMSRQAGDRGREGAVLERY